MKTAIVIGGGISGCSTAYSLAQRGITVTLIERHDKLAQEASGNPVAVLYPKLSTKPNLADTLTLQGFAFTLALLKELPQTKLFEACGLIQLAYHAREEAKQARLLQQDVYQPFLQAVSAQKASEIAGIALKTGGLLLPQAGWVKPQALCNTLCQHPNITQMTASNALSIKKNSRQWQVLIQQNQPLKADIVVICNANDVTQFNQISSAKITPVRGQINFFSENSVSQQLKTIVSSDHFIAPSVDDIHSIGTSYAIDHSNRHLNAALSASDTHTNLQALRNISPDIYASLLELTGRVAWRSATLDYMPLAGQLLDEAAITAKPPRYNAVPESLPWLQGLYLNAGHGSKGMITAPICGELIANLANQEPLIVEAALASRLNPSRFLLRELGLKQLAQSLV